MVQAVLFEDIFDVRVLNENGKKFEKGSISRLLEAMSIRSNVIL
jgi:hypothetical protein